MERSTRRSVAVAHGDGIGPEIMDATLAILEAAGADLDIIPIKIGSAVYAEGITSGVSEEAWEAISATKVVLKAPVTTPQGGGVKSVNVTIRTAFGLFANVRPCLSYAPYVPTRYPGINLVIIRENEEDVYGGIEHRQSHDVAQALKLISRSGSERVVRYAFEYARHFGRKKVTCFSKDNILKMTDGLFHQVFNEVSSEYPDIQADHWIVDIGTARLADTPELFDVIVTPNLYGDIISDVAAEIAGSVGMAGSANIGARVAMFEAIHGSAPGIAGQNVANPSGLLQGAIQMLYHLGMGAVGSRINDAWLYTIESGVHTADIFDTVHSTQLAGTQEFAAAVIANLGQVPRKLAKHQSAANPVSFSVAPTKRRLEEKRLIGVDAFFEWHQSPEELAQRVLSVNLDPFQLIMISNRGQTVYPSRRPETFLVDQYRCRLQAASPIGHGDLVSLLGRLVAVGLDLLKMEGLFEFDGIAGYSLGQGE